MHKSICFVVSFAIIGLSVSECQFYLLLFFTQNLFYGYVCWQYVLETFDRVFCVWFGCFFWRNTILIKLQLENTAHNTIKIFFLSSLLLRFASHSRIRVLMRLRLCCLIHRFYRCVFHLTFINAPKKEISLYQIFIGRIRLWMPSSEKIVN